VGPALRDFRDSELHEFRCPNLDIHKFLKCENGKGETRISGFRCLGFHGFHRQTSNIPQFLNCEKKGTNISDFGVSKVKQRNTTIPEIAKRKESGTNISGFQGLESRTSKAKTSTTTIPEMANRKEHGTNISFWISGFWGFKCQATTHNISRIPKVKGCGTNTSGFQVSGFQMSNHSSHNPRIPKA
jgi:hypothetical protein